MMIPKLSNLHILKLLSVLLCYLSCCRGWTHQSASPFIRPSRVVCHASSTDTPNEDQRRKRKKNKYTKFSKADKLEQDPLDAMIAESKAKVLELDYQDETETQCTASQYKRRRTTDTKRNFVSRYKGYRSI